MNQGHLTKLHSFKSILETKGIRVREEKNIGGACQEIVITGF